MALKTRGLPVTRWQDVLPHSLRSLLCTPSSNLRGDLPAGAQTQRGSPRLGLSYSNVMFEQARVTLWSTKSSANPQYAHIRHADGRETTVSIRHLAPCGDI